MGHSRGGLRGPLGAYGRADVHVVRSGARLFVHACARPHGSTSGFGRNGWSVSSSPSYKNLNMGKL